MSIRAPNPASPAIARPGSKIRHKFGVSELLPYLSVSSFLALSMWMLLLLPNFLESHGWSSSKIGAAMSCYYLMNLLALAFSGRFADRYGTKATSMGGVALGISSGLLYLTAIEVPDLIFVARAVHASGTALVMTGAMVQMIQSVPIQLRGRMLGYFGLPGFVMLGLGPAISEWLVYRWGFEAVFVALIVFFALAGFVLYRLPGSTLVGRNSPVRLMQALRLSFPALRPILFFSAFVGLCLSMWQSFLAPTVRSLGSGAVSNWGIGYALGALIARGGVSHLIESRASRLAGISALFLYGTGLTLIPLVNQSWHLAFVGLMCGMSHGLYFPSLSSMATDRFHPTHTGQGLSLYLSAKSLGMFIGPPVWGLIADQTGYASIFTAAGSLLALGTAVFIAWLWRSAR